MLVGISCLGLNGGDIQALYSIEMALKSYRSTMQSPQEGKAVQGHGFKCIVDSNLKNDTDYLNLAVRAFKMKRYGTLTSG